MSSSSSSSELTNVRDISALMKLIYAHPFDGIDQTKLFNCYPNAAQDLQRCIKAHTLILLIDPPTRHHQPSRATIYPCMKEDNLNVDETYKSLWHEVKMPATQAALDEELASVGYLEFESLLSKHVEKTRRTASTKNRRKESAKQEAKRQKEEDKKRKKAMKQKKKLTNTHLLSNPNYAFLSQK
jgi:hypothetical protein